MNTARFNVQLTPRKTRTLTAMQIAQQFRGPLGRFPGFRAFVNVPPAIQIGAKWLVSVPKLERLLHGGQDQPPA